MSDPKKIADSGGAEAAHPDPVWPCLMVLAYAAFCVACIMAGPHHPPQSTYELRCADCNRVVQTVVLKPGEHRSDAVYGWDRGTCRE